MRQDTHAVPTIYRTGTDMPLLTVRFFSHFAEREAVVGACFPQALAEQLGIGNAVKAWLGVMGGETPSPWSEYFAALWARKRGWG